MCTRRASSKHKAMAKGLSLPQAKRVYSPLADRGFWRALAAKQLLTDAARPTCETEDPIFHLGNGHLCRDNGPDCSFCSPLLTS